MAASVGNLQRRLAELLMFEVDPRIAAELRDTEKLFRLLLPLLQEAEWIRDLHEQEWRRSEARFNKRELMVYRNIDTWASRIAASAADVEEIVVSYNCDLLNLNSTGTLYKKFMYSCSFLWDSNNIVAAKIRNYLSICSQTMIGQVLCPTDQSRNLNRSADDYVLLLRKHSEVLKIMTKKLPQLARITSAQHQHQPQPAVGNFLADHDSISTQTLGSAKMVGREVEVDLLEGWLLETKEEGGPEIISISGEAGIGKTTVAEVVYEQVRRQFDCHAWVFVSRYDSTRRIMQNILKGILESISVFAPNNIGTMEKEPLKKLINIWLTGKKFLLILDDAPSWEIVQEVKDAIPRSSRTAKILITSRLTHRFPFGIDYLLKPIHSSNLLCKHAYSSLDPATEYFFPVQSVVEDIARLCGGLPLATVTVGRMLSTKHMAEDWTDVRQKLMEGASFMSVCYADLSPALQSCFLYAASFPCHFEISCKKLKRLWIAEGFVQNNNDRTLEESAQCQLEELIHRNMIQVVKLSIDGKAKACRVLRRMREFALRRSAGDHFSVILKSLTKSKLPEKCHRVFYYDASCDGSTSKFSQNNFRTLHSLHPLDDSYNDSTSMFSRKNFNGLCSLLILEENTQPLNLNDFKLLSVLELQDFCHELLPDAVGDLALLRYLGLRGGKTKKLPSSFKNLGRLQTLDIRNTFITDLPAELERLRMMRHLLLERSFTNKVVNLRDGIEAFKDIQTLAGLKMTEAIAKGLINLTDIRKLSVGAVQGSHLVHLFKAVERMEFLRSFTMKGSFEEQGDELSLPLLYNLEKLCIGGPIKNNFLDWVGKLQCVKCLYFWDSKLTEDPLGALQHLKNLILLSLCNSYDGKQIEFGERGFPKLKKLSILHCQNLQNWKEIPQGAMTKLETLNLGYCPSLVQLPKGLEELHPLCSIQISNMPAQFMQDAYKLQSVSKVLISVRGTTQCPSNGLC